MSNCFICNIDNSLDVSSVAIQRGGKFFYYAEGLQSIVSVVEYPNQDSAHDNTKTNNYVTYRINGFRYKITLRTYPQHDFNDSIYIVFYKVKITSDTQINLTRVGRYRRFSDFILYKQPNDVIHYRYVNPNDNYNSLRPLTKEVSGFCNKNFFVKPDDVFGVYYLVLSDDQDATYFIDGTVSVYFDVV